MCLSMSMWVCMCVHKSILHALCVSLTMYISLKFRASHCVLLCVSMFETWNVWVCLHVCVFVFVYVCVLWQVLVFSCGFVNVWVVCVCMCTMLSCSNNKQKLCSMSKRFYWHVCASSYYNFTLCNVSHVYIYFIFSFCKSLAYQSWKDFFLRNPLWKSWHFYFYFYFYFLVLPSGFELQHLLYCDKCTKTV